MIGYRRDRGGGASSTGAFAAPTEANRSAFAAARSSLDALDAEIVGGATDFGADSLNEQIVQGLRTPEVLA